MIFYNKSVILIYQIQQTTHSVVFLPTKENQRQFCVDTLNKEFEKQGLEVIGWREVPTNQMVVGEIAGRTLPHIKQVFVRPAEGVALSKKTPTPKHTSQEKLQNTRFMQLKCRKPVIFFYGFSTRTLIYKGLLVPEDIERFYTDLTDKRVVTRLALVHQRFTTNTFPTWDLAQPFRYMCHNGEINTYRGNLNRMKAREELLKSDFFGDDIQSIRPIVLNESQTLHLWTWSSNCYFIQGDRCPRKLMMMVLRHGKSTIAWTL